MPFGWPGAFETGHPDAWVEAIALANCKELDLLIGGLAHIDAKGAKIEPKQSMVRSITANFGNVSKACGLGSVGQRFRGTRFLIGNTGMSEVDPSVSNEMLFARSRMFVHGVDKLVAYPYSDHFTVSPEEVSGLARLNRILYV
jgi:hypothetical protein